MPQRGRFVLTGITRLTLVLAEELLGLGAEVVVVGNRDDDDSGGEIYERLAACVPVVPTTGLCAPALVAAGLAGAAGLLTLEQDDLRNLRVIAAAQEVAPAVPVVMRAFKPELVDHLRSGLGIRRAYSVAALAAPAFVAAVAADEVVSTLRLGDEEVLLCVLDVREGSELAGRSAGQIGDETGCAVVARMAAGSPAWGADPGPAGAVGIGDRLVVGGPVRAVLGLALGDAPPAPAAAQGRPRRHRRVRSPSAARTIRRTLLPVSIVAFALVFAASAVVNGIVFSLSTIDAVSVATGVALGNSGPDTPYEWVKVFNLTTTAAAVGLLWVLLSYLTAVVLAERLESRMVRRARRLSGHVVVVGLGRVGYRVVRLLLDLGIPTVAIERDDESQFLEAVGFHTPVIVGDGRLPETLQRAGVDRARCVLACTDDDIANLLACAEARQLNAEVRTVSHTTDDHVVAHLGGAFRVDRAISSNVVARAAFVGAALDARAIRQVDLGALELSALRHQATTEVSAEQVRRWRTDGVLVLAHLRDGVVGPAAAAGAGLQPGDEVVLVGPSAVVEAFSAR